MGRVSTKPPSGTRDFGPQDVVRRRYVTGIIQEVYESYGFVPIETPAIENLTTLLGKYGEEGDQLLYRLLHRRDALRRALEGDPTESELADQGLRYDLTVPLARFVAQYPDLPRFFKRYQIQPVWRADRPGRGRFREFYQCDIDVTGTESLLAEAEVCSAVCRVLERLGFDSFRIKLNHRGLLRALISACSIDPALEGTALIAVDKLDKIGRDGVAEELGRRGVSEDAAARLLDLLVRPDTDDRAATVAALRAALGAEEAGMAALAQLEELCRLLESTAAAGRVELAPDLARGLGYYTGPILEAVVDDLAGSIGGGGRYDGLVGMFGKREIPAVGFSLGLERILIVMEERGLYPPLTVGPELLLCRLGVGPEAVLEVAEKLRAAGIRVESYPKTDKLGRQLQYASDAKLRYAAILGEDELAAGELTLKDLESGEQSRVAIETVRAKIP